MVALLDFFLSVGRRAHGDVHVRLARTEPNIADQHIRQHELLFEPLNDEGQWATGWERADLRPPFAVCVGHGRGGCAVSLGILNGDRNLIPRSAPPPDRIGNVTLQDHVTGKKCVNKGKLAWLRWPPVLRLRRSLRWQRRFLSESETKREQ